MSGQVISDTASADQHPGADADKEADTH